MLRLLLERSGKLACSPSLPAAAPSRCGVSSSVACLVTLSSALQNPGLITLSQAFGSIKDQVARSLLK